MNIENVTKDIFLWATNVYNELGSGFNETVLQSALAIEFRENKIKYLREPHIEIFYKEHVLGLDRPDFVLLTPTKKLWNMQYPIIVETKVSMKLSNENRQQLKSYLRSFPRNKNSSLQKTSGGILLNFLKTEEFGEQINGNEKIELEFWDYKHRTDSVRLAYSLP